MVFAANEYSLKNATKTINIDIESVDTQEVVLKTDKRMKSYDFSKLKPDISSVKKHIKRIEKIRTNLKKLTSLKTQMEENYVDIKLLEDDLKKAKQRYDRAINKIYHENKQLERYSYLVVISKGDKNYEKDLESFIIDKFAIKKYDQSTTLNKSLASVEMQSVIKTQKDFGQKSVDTIYDFVDRTTGTTIKVLKVTQNPFVKSASNSSNKAMVRKNDNFAESKVQIYDLANEDLTSLQFDLEDKYKVPDESLNEFMSNLKPKIDLMKYSIDFAKSTAKINQVLKKLEQEHVIQSEKVLEIQDKYDSKKDINKQIAPVMDDLLQQTQKLLKPYNISLTKEAIGKISIITPKIYSEIVQYKEERDYIRRKVKSFVSKIKVTDLQQSDTLVNFADLSSVTKNQHKTVEFESIHLLPYLDVNNKIGVLIFAAVEIKDKLDQNDALEFHFKYDEIEFIPVQKGYKTIFVAQTEVTLGLVKEFLETHSYKRYFDQYCIDESLLPEEAKNYKKVPQEYYKYPAVCFKVDNIDGFLSWVSKKIKRDVIIPKSEDWSYVATNGGTTDYCWGNATPDELLEDDKLPENIYLEENDKDTTIEKVGSYSKSKLGIYDMCGNVFELVKQDGDLGYKGNSFSSYIEVTNDEAEMYEDDINPTLGLRLFYIKDLTNE